MDGPSVFRWPQRLSRPSVFPPFAVGKPVTLEFTMAEIVALGAAAVVTTQIAQDGQSNWLNGLQILIVYAMIGVLFFFLPS